MFAKIHFSAQADRHVHVRGPGARLPRRRRRGGADRPGRQGPRRRPALL